MTEAYANGVKSIGSLITVNSQIFVRIIFIIFIKTMCHVAKGLSINVDSFRRKNKFGTGWWVGGPGKTRNNIETHMHCVCGLACEGTGNQFLS